MNPQYMPQQQYGGLRQGPPMSNKMSPSLPQGVQNLPQGLPNTNYYPSKYGPPMPNDTSSLPPNQNSEQILPTKPPTSTDSMQMPPLPNVQQGNFPPPPQQNGSDFNQYETSQLQSGQRPVGAKLEGMPGQLQNMKPNTNQYTPTSQPMQAGSNFAVDQNSNRGMPQNLPVRQQGINQPPLPNQFQPPGQTPMSRQPPMPGQQTVASFPVQGQPSLSGQGQPLLHGQGMPPLPGQPPLMGQGQPPLMGQGQPPLMGQGQPPMQGPGQPPIPGPGQPPMPGQGQPPMPGQKQPPMFAHGQPPMPGLKQPPMPGQGQPPMPGQGQPPLPGQGQPPMPGQPPFAGQNMPQFAGQPPLPGQSMGQPPLPGQQMFSANQPGLGYQAQQPNYSMSKQLTNQMQNMNLDGQRQYPGGPMKQALNGEGGPHMPPPLGQQGYLNGQSRGPSYPPMPGPGGMQSGPVPGAYSQPPYQQQAVQQKRLDPDQMPSPIQVMQDDQKTRSGVFCTNQKGLVPPLVTTQFVVQDQGNSSPRFIRSTMYNVPVTQDLMKQTAVPFGLVISPMARTVNKEYPPPIANFGELGPVRCIRCKAYMCPYMQFIDSGRRFQCLFCKATTDVPTEYFQHLDHTGQRMDRYERPELVLGTYEFTATKDYCRDNTFPNPPAFIFVIDVSYNNIKSGLVRLLCSQMKNIIRNLPIDEGMDKSNMRVGFITYNSAVHFYNIKGSLAAPQMMVVGDIQDMFMPLLDGFLCTPEESDVVIDALMEQIPIMFGETRETETILLPAILAGMEALKASNCTGKLLVFHSSLPTAEAPGKLKNRDDRKVLATEKEKTVLTPQNQAYNQLGQDCVGVGCCVDLFLFNNAYIDIATIGQVARLTGGEVYKYTYFQADLDGERLIADVINDVSKPIAFDAIMRVRTSTGIRPTDFYGHFYMSNTTDMELGAIDCDKAVTVEIKHDDKLTEEEGVYIQVALLFTSCSGQRRLRVINLSLKTCSQMADLFKSCDLDTLINFFSKQSIYKLVENNPKAVKDNIVNRSAQILACYRKNCATPSSAGQLILPECMKLMPLYVNCLLKSDALSGGSDMTVDDRSFVMQAVITMDVPTSVTFFYPRLIPLHELEVEEEYVEIPDQIRCTIEKMTDQGVYLLENGVHMLIWIGLNLNPTFCQQVFGVQSPVQIDVDKVKIPKLDNALNKTVHSIIDRVRSERHRSMRLTLVRQREKLEPIFKHFLVEDHGLDNSPSYVDFLCHMHKEIRTILS